jgi:hypothetical protein
MAAPGAGARAGATRRIACRNGTETRRQFYQYRDFSAVKQPVSAGMAAAHAAPALPNSPFGGGGQKSPSPTITSSNGLSM